MLSLRTPSSCWDCVCFCSHSEVELIYISACTDFLHSSFILFTCTRATSVPSDFSSALRFIVQHNLKSKFANRKPGAVLLLSLENLKKMVLALTHEWFHSTQRLISEGAMAYKDEWEKPIAENSMVHLWSEALCTILRSNKQSQNSSALCWKADATLAIWEEHSAS